MGKRREKSSLLCPAARRRRRSLTTRGRDVRRPGRLHRKAPRRCGRHGPHFLRRPRQHRRGRRPYSNRGGPAGRLHLAAALPDHFYGNAIASMFYRSASTWRGPPGEHPGLDKLYEFRPRRRPARGHAMRYTDSAAAGRRAHGAQPGAAHAGRSALAREEQLRAHVLGMPPPRRRRRCLSPPADYVRGPSRAAARRRAPPRAALLQRRPNGRWLL